MLEIVSGIVIVIEIEIVFWVVIEDEVEVEKSLGKEE